MNLKNKLKNFPHIYYTNLDNRTDRRENYMEDQKLIIGSCPLLEYLVQSF